MAIALAAAVRRKGASLLKLLYWAVALVVVLMVWVLVRKDRVAAAVRGALERRFGTVSHFAIFGSSYLAIVGERNRFFVFGEVGGGRLVAWVVPPHLIKDASVKESGGGVAHSLSVDLRSTEKPYLKFQTVSEHDANSWRVMLSELKATENSNDESGLARVAIEDKQAASLARRGMQAAGITAAGFATFYYVAVVDMIDGPQLSQPAELNTVGGGEWRQKAGSTLCFRAKRYAYDQYKSQYHGKKTSAFRKAWDRELGLVRIGDVGARTFDSIHRSADSRLRYEMFGRSPHENCVWQGAQGGIVVSLSYRFDRKEKHQDFLVHSAALSAPFRLNNLNRILDSAAICVTGDGQRCSTAQYP